MGSIVTEWIPSSFSLLVGLHKQDSIYVCSESHRSLILPSILSLPPPPIYYTTKTTDITRTFSYSSWSQSQTSYSWQLLLDAQVMLVTHSLSSASGQGHTFFFVTCSVLPFTSASTRLITIRSADGLFMWCSCIKVLARYHLTRVPLKLLIISYTGTVECPSSNWT